MSHNIKTIFYQGVYNSQVQLAKYLSNGFIATTGEHVSCDKSLDLIIQPFIGNEIDEIELYELKGWKRIFNWLNPLKIFSYIFTFLAQKHNHIVVNSDTESLEAQEQSLKAHYINLSKFNFGQEGDMANHYEKYTSCIKQYPQHDIILWGVSKGAATTLNSLASNNYDISKIKLVVLEGCFSDIQKVFLHWVQHRSYFDSNYWLARLALWLIRTGLASYVTRYKKDPKYSPINMLQKIPHSVPICFITSATDIVVPCEQTIELYTKLKESGHPDVHLLVLKNSRHHAYMFDCIEDRKAYKNFIHKIYSQYGIA